MSRQCICNLDELKKLTKDITEICFTFIFDESLDGLIPEWIKIIKFDSASLYNHEISILPADLEELIFNECKTHTET